MCLAQRKHSLYTVPPPHYTSMTRTQQDTWEPAAGMGRREDVLSKGQYEAGQRDTVSSHSQRLVNGEVGVKWTDSERTMDFILKLHWNIHGFK